MIHRLLNGWQHAITIINSLYSHLILTLIFKASGVKHGSFHTSGIPYLHASIGSKITIGNSFTLGNSLLTSATGLRGRCKIEVRNGAELIIGDNVGMTMTSITCTRRISIGDNVTIGFGVHIFDTDFHSLNPKIRCTKNDHDSAKRKSIMIADNVFIGAMSIITKGVNIGQNAIIAAGSVVTRDIPANEVWGGNPARKIR